MVARYMANLPSLRELVSPQRSGGEDQIDDAGPSRLAILSGGAITFTLVFLLLIV